MPSVLNWPRFALPRARVVIWPLIGSRLIAPQNELEFEMKHSFITYCAETPTMRFETLMLYQSSAPEKPGRNDGLYTKPRVLVTAVSGVRKLLPAPAMKAVTPCAPALPT